MIELYLNYDLTMAILVPQNIEVVVILCSKPIVSELYSFIYVNSCFVPIVPRDSESAPIALIKSKSI